MKRVIVGSLLSLVVAIVFSPGLLTLAWHLGNGHSIGSHGRIVFVPNGWRGSNSGNNIRLVKYPLTIFSRPPILAVITIDSVAIQPKNEIGKEQSYKLFSSQLTTLPDKTAVTRGPIRNGSGAGETFCMETTFPASPGYSDIACLIGGGKWIATFRGWDPQLRVFQQVIEN